MTACRGLSAQIELAIGRPTHLSLHRGSDPDRYQPVAEWDLGPPEENPQVLRAVVEELSDWIDSFTVTFACGARITNSAREIFGRDRVYVGAGDALEVTWRGVTYGEA